MLSLCNCNEVAADGDAHFFFVQEASFGDADVTECSAHDGDSFVSFDAFRFLQSITTKRSGDKFCTVEGAGQKMCGLWLPLYATADHFERAVLLLPDALGMLVRADPLLFEPSQFDCLFSLMGRSVVAMIASSSSLEHSYRMLLHKMRSLHAVAHRIRGVELAHDPTLIQQLLFLGDTVGKHRSDGKSLAGVSMYMLVADAFISINQTSTDTRHDVVERFRRAMLVELVERRMAALLSGVTDQASTVTTSLETNTLALQRFLLRTQYTVLGAEVAAAVRPTADSEQELATANLFDQLYSVVITEPMSRVELDLMHSSTPQVFSGCTDALGNSNAGAHNGDFWWSHLREALDDVAVPGALDFAELVSGLQV
jgi:hypothetical protein